MPTSDYPRHGSLVSTVLVVLCLGASCAADGEPEVPAAADGCGERTSESCNGLDDDCDGVIDDGLGLAMRYADGDGDGWGRPGSAALRCAGTPGYVDNHDDCDDLDVVVGAPLATGPFLDADGDGFGDSEEPRCPGELGAASIDGDCDDGAGAVHPGATDVAGDGVDQDCSGEDTRDRDGDGAPDDVDCAAYDPTDHPAAAERCDGRDNDCNGLADDGLPTGAVFMDWDGDGFGIGAPLEDFCAGYPGTAPGGGDCYDGDPTVHPAAVETCDGADENCDAVADEGLDLDGDGVTPCGPDGQVWMAADNDCDDANSAIHPAAIELCDAVDDDCDMLLDDGLDLDGDGVTPCGPDAQLSTGADNDCDDTNPAIHPTAIELCDAEDDDCDTVADDGLDLDGDGLTPCGVDGQVSATSDNDCDDNNASVHPGAPELCNALDDDCDGVVDEGVLLDFDGDGFTPCGTDGAPSIGSDDDCDDGNARVRPGATERCNAVDDDCDTVVDDGFDLDGDGLTVCGPDGEISTAPDNDCDDGNPSVRPGAPELCNAADDDCDAMIDDGLDLDGDALWPCGADGVLGNLDDDCDDSNAAVGLGTSWFWDGGDFDGFGDSLLLVVACEPPVAAYVAAEGDCGPANPSAFPGAPESCDGLDGDCDGMSDTFDADGDGAPECLDCDDDDLSAFPLAPEACDGVDSDCDGDLIDGFGDFDGDGSPNCWDDDADADGAGSAEGDCDDVDPDRSPLLAELCGDGLDNDCNGAVEDPGSSACLCFVSLAGSGLNLEQKNAMCWALDVTDALVESGHAARDGFMGALPGTGDPTCPAVATTYPPTSTPWPCGSSSTVYELEAWAGGCTTSDAVDVFGSVDDAYFFQFCDSMIGNHWGHENWTASFNEYVVGAGSGPSLAMDGFLTRDWELLGGSTIPSWSHSGEVEGLSFPPPAAGSLASLVRGSSWAFEWESSGFDEQFDKWNVWNLPDFNRNSVGTASVAMEGRPWSLSFAYNWYFMFPSPLTFCDVEPGGTTHVIEMREVPGGPVAHVVALSWESYFACDGCGVLELDGVPVGTHCL